MSNQPEHRIGKGRWLSLREVRIVLGLTDGEVIMLQQSKAFPIFPMSSGLIWRADFDRILGEHGREGLIAVAHDYARANGKEWALPLSERLLAWKFPRAGHRPPPRRDRRETDRE